MANSRFFCRLCVFACTALLIQGCATDDYVTLSYSSEFSLALPSADLSGSTIFSSEELSLKTDEGHLLSGQVISNESESLSDDVAMAQYPQFLFGLEPLESLDSGDAALLRNSASEIRHTYGSSTPTQDTVGLYTIHTLCSSDACLAYVVKQGFDDHILMVHGLDVTREDFTSLINGGLNADRE